MSGHTPPPRSPRNGALGGAALTTTIALLMVDPQQGLRANAVFVGGMAIVGAFTGAAMSVKR